MSEENIRTGASLSPILMKTSLKLAAPSIVILMLLCYGIYLGSVNRDAVLRFERVYLGMDAEEVQPDFQPWIQPVAELTQATIRDLNSLPARVPLDVLLQQHDSESVVNPLSGRESSTPSTVPPVEPEQLPVVSSCPEQPRKVTGKTESSISLLVKRDLPVTIKIKVLVDDKYLADHSDWMARIQATIGEASRIYRDNFGIDLYLIGLGRWPIATTGRDSRQLYEDLIRRPREGADVLLGLVSRELDSPAYSLGNPSEGPLNGAFGIAGTSGDTDSFLSGALRCISHLLGALEAVDENSEEYRLGTWMSVKPVSVEHSPWIDANSRRRILENKTRPFALAGRKGG